MLAAAEARSTAVPLRDRIFYWLDDDEDLSKHRGQRVEIQGELEDFEKGKVEVDRKDDYTKVFGKHFMKAGVLVSANKKNEDTIGNGSNEHSAFWGSTGLPSGGSATGNTGHASASQRSKSAYPSSTCGSNARPSASAAILAKRSSSS